MRTTVDGAGKVVIPKAIRDLAGLDPGVVLEVEFRDGQVVLEPATVRMRVVRRRQRSTIESESEMPTLTSSDVRAALDRVRR